MKTPSTYILFSLCLFLLSPALHAQGDNDIDPKTPGWKYFPKVGEMIGATGTEWGALGRELIRSVGDVNNDGLQDWILSRVRGDIEGTLHPQEMMLFVGSAGELPDRDKGVRIGPTEVGTITEYLTSGDWDNDGNLDLAMSTRLLGDTSQGNTGYSIKRLVIFWGNGTGTFDIADTSRLILENGKGDLWLVVSKGLTGDLNHDGIDDLMIEGQGTFYAGEWGYTPEDHFFFGKEKERWGNNGDQTPDFQWWEPHAGASKIFDHDRDGLDDILFRKGSVNDPDYQVSVLYGELENEYPDTANIETVSLSVINATAAQLDDVTGDGVAELIVTSGSESLIRIYAGKPGQRIIDQFGTGNEGPHPERGEWWYRPWAQICMADKLNRGYFGSSGCFVLADGNLDRTPDIWTFDRDLILCYVAGEQLDSLIDGFMYIPNGGSPIVNLGIIDGTKIPTIAVRAGTSAVSYYKPTRDLPFNGYFRKLPHISSSVPDDKNTSPLPINITVFPNPSGGSMTINWSVLAGNQFRNISMSITDLNGSEVYRKRLFTHEGNLNWNTKEVPDGVYYVTVQSGATAQTEKIIVRH